MDRVVRASLGPAPLPYIFSIALFPVWILFSNNDHSLLYSLFAVTTILLKGSLFSHWIACRSVSWKFRLTSFLVVTLLEIEVTHEALHISWIPLVILVPLSTMTGVLILRLHLGKAGAASSNVIGIFSRSAPEEYHWLLEGLRRSGTVLPFCITNNNVREFEKRVSQCSSAILYHSKTQGRVNITDVADSLYDQELRHLSGKLGLNKVWVTVDDLDDSSDDAKRRILQGQPTIRQKTRDLLLFTRKEKSDTEITNEKLQPLTAAVSQGSVSFLISDVIAILLLAAPWLHFLCNVYQEASLALSNLSGSLLLYFLLPSRAGGMRAGLALLLVVTIAELLTAFFNDSGIRATGR